MIGAGVSFSSHARNALDFSLNSDTLFSVMRFHAKYFVEVKSATGRLEFVRWFAPSHEGLEAAITCAREAKSSVKCRVARATCPTPLTIGKSCGRIPSWHARC